MSCVSNVASFSRLSIILRFSLTFIMNSFVYALIKLRISEGVQGKPYHLGGMLSGYNMDLENRHCAWKEAFFLHLGEPLYRLLLSM